MADPFRLHLDACSAEIEAWPLRQPFRIARGSFSRSLIAVVRLSDGTATGCGEAEAHEYDEAEAAIVLDHIRAATIAIAANPSREALATSLPAGPIRNALDCALWDLEAKRSGRRAWALAGLDMISETSTVSTCFSMGMTTPDEMARMAAAFPRGADIKVKLGDVVDEDIARAKAVRAAAPASRISLDANGGWTLSDLKRFTEACAHLDFAFIEQPLPPETDSQLAGFRSPIPLCADESFTDSQSLPRMVGQYDWVNIKLDKTGGLTEALAIVRMARAAGMKVMTGCNIGTSLAMAPAFLVASLSDFVDLDGPLLLARDREPGLAFSDATITAPSPQLWG